MGKQLGSGEPRGLAPAMNAPSLGTDAHAKPQYRGVNLLRLDNGHCSSDLGVLKTTDPGHWLSSLH